MTTSIGTDTNGIRNPSNGSPNGVLPEQQGKTADHTVVPGDTLYEIWQNSGSDCTWEEFLAANQHIDNPDWIYPGDSVFYPEGGGKPDTGGTDETGKTGGNGETGETGGKDQPGSNSPEAKEVDQAQEDYDTAVTNYNAHPTDENWEAVGKAREKLEAAIQAEAEADVAALDPPPGSYEEYQQAVADSVERIAARYPDDSVVAAATDAVESRMTSVEYLEEKYEDASKGVSPPAQEEAGRIHDLLEGARAVHESPEAKQTQSAAEELAAAEENLETQQNEGTPNEITEAEERVAAAQERLEAAIAAEINARVEASGATDPEEIAEIEQQVRQDILNRTGTGSHDAVNAAFEGASQLAQTQRTTDSAAGNYDGAKTSYDNKYGEGNLDMGHATALERVESTRARLKSAVETEIAAGIEDYKAEHPDATPEEIEAEAERLGDEIVARNGDSENVREVVDTVVDDYN